MDLGEARGIAKQYIHHFRAFERIKEVLDTAAQAESIVADFQRRRDALAGEIPGLEAEKIRVGEAVEEARSKAEAEVARIEGETAHQLAELRGQVETEEARVRDELAALQGRLEAAIEEHRAVKETMEREAAELTARVAGLKQELADVAARHRLQPLSG